MPSRAEIIKLTHRVEELTKIVQQAKVAGKARNESTADTAAKPKAATRTKAKAKAKAATETTA
jgi:hypothetical protein